MSERPTLVLVHGAGDTSLVWRGVQRLLVTPSIAVDVPGRRDRPADITRVTIRDAVDSIERDVDGVTDGQLVLVAHSMFGVVIPSLAARFGDRVDHLVFVAGVTAKDGERAVDSIRPGGYDQVAARVEDLRVKFADHTFKPEPLPESADGAALHPIDEERVAQTIDASNFMCQVVSWEGVRADIPRTFIRSLRDPIQSRELQAALIENCAATSVIDIDTKHNAARETPQMLADLLDAIALGAAATSPLGVSAEHEESDSQQ
jgi:pimeloyl-ACP methyl ester carboxylesterase